MILTAILLITLVAIVIMALVALLAGGIGTMLAFGDVIVFGVIVYLIVKAFIKRKKSKKEKES